MNNLLSMLDKGAGGLLKIVHGLTDAQYQTDPQMEADAGVPGSAAANDQAKRAGMAAYQTAAAHHVPWYAMGAMRDAAAQDAYTGTIQDAYKIAEARRAAQKEQDRHDRLAGLIKKGSLLGSNGKALFTPDQTSMLSGMDPDQQQKVITEQMFPKPTDPNGITPVNGGYVDNATKQFHQTEKVYHGAAGGGGVMGTAELDAQLQADLKNPGMILAARKAINGEKIPTRSVTYLQRLNNVVAALGASEGTDPDQLAQVIQRNQMDAHSIGKLNDQAVFVSSAQGALHKHLAYALQLVNKVDSVGMPVIDRWLRAGAREIKGDADVNNFNMVWNEAKQEYAKILSGASGSISGVTKEAADQAEQYFHPGANAALVKGVLNTAENVARDKAQSVYDERENFFRGLPGTGYTPRALPPISGPTAQPARPGQPAALPPGWSVVP